MKVERPDLEHQVQYPHKMLEQITGSLEIVGSSPNNDRHLFTQILANDKISEIKFNYFDKQEAVDAEQLFQSKSLKVREVQELWRKCKHLE